MLKCIWCDWEGTKKSLDDGVYCPGCGGSQFIKKEKVKKNEPELGKAASHKRKTVGR